MKSHDTPKSGKLGNRVAYRSRFGDCEREYVRPRPKPTAAQLRANTIYGQTSQLYNQLPDARVQAWNQAGKRVHSKPRHGRSGPLTGQMFFLRINLNQASVGLPPLLDPPKPPTFSLPFLRALHITRRRGKPVLKLELTHLPPGHVLVAASHPHNAGRRYCDKFLELGLLPTPKGGLSDITQLYAARFGLPRPCSRVFVRVLQQINGFRSHWLSTHALVPALHPTRSKAPAPASA